MKEKRFSVAAYAVIQNDDGDVLLTRRRESDDWVLPGGTVKETEAPWEAVVREVAEETGLEVAVDRLIGVYAKRRERDLVLVFVQGFAPLLGGPLWRVEAWFHDLTGRHFLARVSRETR